MSDQQTMQTGSVHDQMAAPASSADNGHVLNKRVLIVSTWAPPALGGPQNLYNIFSRIDGHQYAIFTSIVNEFRATPHSGSRLPCRYYFYDDAERFPANPPGTPLFIKGVRKVRKGMMLLKRLSGIIRRGFRIIKDDHVDLLLGISDPGRALILTYVLSQLSGKPYALYLFDLYRGNDFPQPWKLISHLVEPLLFKHARRIIVTNERTKQHYMERYGRDIYDVVYNSVPSETYEAVRTDYNPKPPYTIVFTGHIYWPQERSVRNLLRAVSTMHDLSLRCLIYSPNPPKDLVKEYANHPGIVFDVASHADMPAIQSRADVLFLPFSWGTKSPDIISTASPGKLTDYLIAGRPILIHAPPYAFVSRYAREHHCGHVVDEENIQALQSGIKKLVEDTAYARELIANARRVFYANHEAGPNARKMCEILNAL
jgi:glycosyltransferase involved in cell wall biosynthesis